MTISRVLQVESGFAQVVAGAVQPNLDQEEKGVIVSKACHDGL
jgi:hypothetical protein